MSSAWLSAYAYRLRLILVAVGIELGLVAALLWIGLQHGERLLARELQTRLENEAILFQAALAPPLAERNLVLLQETLQQMHALGAVIQARLSDAEGKLLTQVGEAAPSEAPRHAVTLPIRHAGTLLGTLHYDIDTAAAEAARRQIIAAALGTGAAAVVLSLLLLLALGYRMMARLGRLVDKTKRIAAGERGVRLATARRDEIGQLAAAIDEMATALLRQQEELAESERRLRFVLKASRDGVWDWDVEHGHTYFSQRFRELLGYEDEAEFRREFNFREALHPEDRQRALEAVQASLDAHQRFDETYRLRCKDGGYRWFRGRGEPECDETGRVFRFAGSISDVTAQQEAELALAESERRLHYAVSGSSDIIWDWDLVSGRYYISPRFCELLGHTPEELPQTRESFLARLHPEDRPRIEAAVERHFREGVPYDIEYRLRHRDGSWHWFRGRGAAVRDASGRVLRFAGAASDIQTQKEAEATIRALLAEQQALLDNALVGICVIRERRIANCNRRFEELYGYEPGELKGQSLRLLYPSDAFYEEMRQRVYPVLERGESYTDEIEVVRKDGSRFWCAISGCALSAQAPMAGSVWVSTDASERRRAMQALEESRQELQRLNEELERRVQERTAELSAANKELEAFSYSVSHDLTAPLRAINGFSRLLEEDYAQLLDERAKDYIARVRAATQRMQRIIDDMLTLSRITRREMKRESVDLSALAEDILSELKHLQPQREVRPHVAAGLQAHGDAGLLRIALDNLLRNAWKFTARHQAARIDFDVLHKDGEKVYFVRDDGAGFDMQYASKLFAPFQRMHGEQEFEGTGIGLAIVQRIIRRHGGHIWAEAAPEQGATFYFTLPE